MYEGITITIRQSQLWILKIKQLKKHSKVWFCFIKQTKYVTSIIEWKEKKDWRPNEDIWHVVKSIINKRWKQSYQYSYHTSVKLVIPINRRVNQKVSLRLQPVND